MAGFARFSRVFLPSFLAISLLAVPWCGGKAASGNDTAAAEYVRLALAHEAHGRQEFRQHFLEAALLVSPEYAPAHWHLGHVQVDGRWVPAAEAQELAAQDEALARYSKLRDKALGDPRREVALARLAQREKWSDRADLHLASVALHPATDPRSRSEAMRRLNLVNVNGTLLTEEEAEQAREAAERVASALKKWRPRLEQWRRAIEAEGAVSRDAALVELSQIDDPEITPVLESFALDSGAEFGENVIAVLEKIPQHRSTQALASFAVVSPWENVRDRAIAELKRRPLHDYVPALLEGLVAPVYSKFLITMGPLGTVRYQHFFLRRNAGGDYVIAREHVATPVLLNSSPPGRSNGPDNVAAAVETQRKAKIETFRSALEASRYEETIASGNARVIGQNDPILAVLQETTGENLGPDPADWQVWWQRYNEMPSNRATYYAYYPTQRTYVSDFTGFDYTVGNPMSSCFAAGTPVWTEFGLVRIEDVRPGDRVLSQSPTSGELAYKVVLRTTAAPPASATVRVALQNESIHMTRAHVVWVAGQGWRMAKELQPGDRLHGLNGVLRTEATEPLPPEMEVYNLVVADFNTYFVGKSGLFVHDITYRKPTRASVPGLTWGAKTGNPVPPSTPSLPRQFYLALQQ